MSALFAGLTPDSTPDFLSSGNALRGNSFSRRLVDGAITVSGIGLPSDGADLQRLKLVAAGSSCLSAVPAEVEGIACVESTRSVTFTMREGQKKTNTGTDSDTVYTFCGPKPTSSTPKSATFGGIEVTAMTMEMSYDVCYCASGNGHPRP